jgi:hypothetical protein
MNAGGSSHDGAPLQQAAMTASLLVVWLCWTHMQTCKCITIVFARDAEHVDCMCLLPCTKQCHSSGSFTFEIEEQMVGSDLDKADLEALAQ